MEGGGGKRIRLPAKYMKIYENHICELRSEELRKAGFDCTFIVHESRED